VKKKIIVSGPGLTRSGYGEQCRFALRALRAHEDRFDIYFNPLNWGNTSWIADNDEERLWFDSLIRRTMGYNQAKGKYDYSLQVTIPNEWQNMATINIGYTAGIETDRVAPEWIQAANSMNKIIVVSNHSKEIYEKTSYLAKNDATGETVNLVCNTPIEVVNFPARNVQPTKIDLELSTKFNFLTVAQWSPRKNLKNTFRWFVEEFFDQDVGLVVKANMQKNCLLDRSVIYSKLEAALNKPEYKDRKCKVYLLHGDMTDEEMSGLYHHPKIKAYTTLTHGEGFGLPIFEAVQAGLPVVAPGWSGHLDFLSAPGRVDRSRKGKNKNNNKMRPHFVNIDFDLSEVQKRAVWDGVIQADSKWAYAKQGSYKMNLRKVYKDYSKHASTAKKLQKHVLKEFSEKTMYEKFANAVLPASEVVSDAEIESLFGALNDLQEDVG
jgi:glycosyltransferase involved in cell wall biosynthesis